MTFLDNLLDSIQPYFPSIFFGLLLLLVALAGTYWFLIAYRQKNESRYPTERPLRNLAEEASAPIRPATGITSAETPRKSANPQTPPVPPLQDFVTTPKDLKALEDGSLTAIGAKVKKARQMARDRVMPDAAVSVFDNVHEAGKSAMAENRWEAARKYFEEALKFKPEDPEIYVNLAIACYELGDMPQAEKYYTEAIGRHPLAEKAFSNYLAFRV